MTKFWHYCEPCEIVWEIKPAYSNYNPVLYERFMEKTKKKSKEENKMVYVERKDDTKNKIERKVVVGKLISIKCEQDAQISATKYKRLDFTLVKDDETYLNVRAYALGTGNEVKLPIDLEELKEVNRADELLKNRKKPRVEMQVYSTDKEVTDMDGIKKIYTNFKCNLFDLKNFKILKEENDINKNEEVVK